MGPLAGLKLVEVAGIGPGPFAGMLLADLGAEVIRVDRPGFDPLATVDPMRRNRRSIVLDLKNPDGLAVLLRLVERNDGLIEGFRPGVAERLGFGPDVCLQRNPRLVYGRITGWGQTGPLANAAGHDLNYLALAGALLPIGRAGDKPVPPLNLIADFGGGAMLLAVGMLAALLEAARSGRGQVVDAAMLEGVNALLAMFHGLAAVGRFDGQTGTHFLSGAAHYYGTYATKDGRFVAIAALEPQFYAELIRRAGLDPELFAAHGLGVAPPDPATWQRLRTELAAVIATKTRDEWCALLEGTDACFAPVLSVDESARHPHQVARGAFIDVGGVRQHRPAPRFSRTECATPKPPRRPGADSRAVLAEVGYESSRIDELIRSGAVAGR